MENNHQVTVLINCFNEEKLIARAIDSALKQTYKNLEVIIWDDGSTDKTFEIAQSFNDNRIKVFRNSQNLGLGKSRIKAQTHISGDYVTILDADDYYANTKIEKQVEIFKKHEDVSLVTTWTKLFDENNKIFRLFNSNLGNNELRKLIIFYNFLFHSSIMYRTKIAKKVGWYSKEFEYSQDYDLTLKILKQNKLHVIKEYLTFASFRGNNMSTSKNLQMIVSNEKIDICQKILKNYNLEKKQINLLNDIININLIKKYLTNLSFLKIFLILIKNPFIIFKFSLMKNIHKKINEI
tara:strand:- start:3326 stop:4207 length:882 start_codon:yes stop_codon:yes gene_type:complete